MSFFCNEGNRFLSLRSKSPHINSLYQIWKLDWTKQLVLTAFPHIIGRTQKRYPISSVQRVAAILYCQTSPKFVCPHWAACFWAACCPVIGVLQTRQRRENLDKFVNWRFCKEKNTSFRKWKRKVKSLHVSWFRGRQQEIRVNVNGWTCSSNFVKHDPEFFSRAINGCACHIKWSKLQNIALLAVLLM